MRPTWPSARTTTLVRSRTARGSPKPSTRRSGPSYANTPSNSAHGEATAFASRSRHLPCERQLSVPAAGPEKTLPPGENEPDPFSLSMAEPFRSGMHREHALPCSTVTSSQSKQARRSVLRPRPHSRSASTWCLPRLIGSKTGSECTFTESRL